MSPADSSPTRLAYYQSSSKRPAGDRAFVDSNVYPSTPYSNSLRLSPESLLTFDW